MQVALWQQVSSVIVALSICIFTYDYVIWGDIRDVFIHGNYEMYFGNVDHNAHVGSFTKRSGTLN